MATRLINFTKGEAAALLHRLEAGTLAEVLTDDPEYAHSADAIEERCTNFAAQLKSRAPFVCLHNVGDPLRDLDLDILGDCIEGSTWVAVNDTGSHQAGTAAYYTLKRAAAKICAAFDKSPDLLEVPRA